MNKVVAVVVTYNRKKMLSENLEALLKQTYKWLDILIVDNGSTDGTDVLVEPYLAKENVLYINTGKNLGGAGGFNIGIKEAIHKEYKYCWVMDDDTIPMPEALDSLVTKANMLENKFSFLCSLVRFNETEIAKMNIPIVSKEWIADFDLCKENNLIRVESCSFVSCFINLEHAKEVGLPIKEFFIYGDDVEYTLRLGKRERAYVDLDSIVLHKMLSNEDTSIEYVEPKKIQRAFYTYRNRLYINKKIGAKETFLYFMTYFYSIIKIIKKSKQNKLKRILVITKGMLCGIVFNPKIEKII